MWMPTGLMVIFLASLTVEANLTVDANLTVEANLTALRPPAGCCVFNETIWESSEDLWDLSSLSKGPLVERTGCHPGVFVVQPGCHFAVAYDQQREMLSIKSVSNGYYIGRFLSCQVGYDTANCSEQSESPANVRSAHQFFRYIRYRKMFLFSSAPYPQNPFNCVWYAGNNLKPTCSNITDTGKCDYVRDAETGKFRFANRTCKAPEEKLLSPGCCVYDKPIWESSEYIWKSMDVSMSILQSNPHCSPGRFENRLGCHYSIFYDLGKEMFSIASINSNDSVIGDWECQQPAYNFANCSEKPQPFEKVPSANTIFRRIRHDHMQKFFAAPYKYNSYCPWYAGSEDQPICTFNTVYFSHTTVNVDDDRQLCEYLHFPATNKFRYVRFCEWSKDPEVNRSNEVKLGVGIVITVILQWLWECLC